MTERKSMIGEYGRWATSIVGRGPGELSLRRTNCEELETWRRKAQKKLKELLAGPSLPKPETKVKKSYEYDNLLVKELNWQLPYGKLTKGVLLRPKKSSGDLPGILGLHDHAGVKYFGKRKIAKTPKLHHPMMDEHQENYYGGKAWANELAKLGYVVLVPDAFAFASRRVRVENVPEVIRDGTSPVGESENREDIQEYNRWAASHESIMAKSLLSAGTTWPGIFLAEDRTALDILSATDGVDENRIGCAGLSGGGLRTVFLAGIDSRIKSAVCVGMMTTWRDFLLNKSYTHTWMCYVPRLPRFLNYPEILGLRAPKATLILNNEDDPLFTLSEMKRATEILEDVYREADSLDKYQFSFYPGPHKFDLSMQSEAFDWFEKTLTEA